MRFDAMVEQWEIYALKIEDSSKRGNLAKMHNLKDLIVDSATVCRDVEYKNIFSMMGIRRFNENEKDELRTYWERVKICEDWMEKYDFESSDYYGNLCSKAKEYNKRKNSSYGMNFNESSDDDDFFLGEDNFDEDFGENFD